jgi:hypothetical protein
MLILIYVLSWLTIEYHGIHPIILIGLFVILSVFYFVLWVIFIYYASVKYPSDQKTRLNDTLMICFLGIIGMWIWLPDKKELERLAERNTTHNNA